MPYFENHSDGLVCLFDQLSSVDILKIKDDIKNGIVERIATIDSPFIENLIQRMNAYLMRLGVRDIEKVEIARVLEQTKLN